MTKKKVAAVLPARLASSRFPGKPLTPIMGLPMIEHVRRRVQLAEAVDEVYVATCDREIAAAVESFGGRAVMTADTHERCTDRVEEAARSIAADLIVIVAGDEPLLLPETINAVVSPALENEAVECVNLLTVIASEAEFKSADVVKALVDYQNNIICFSRSPLPYFRVKTDQPVYRQTGIQTFTKLFLQRFSRLAPTPLEIAESIDFMRIIEHGYKVRAAISACETHAVDQPADVGKVEAVLRNDPLQRKLFGKIFKS